jgi:hypothetical protein
VVVALRRAYDARMFRGTRRWSIPLVAGLACVFASSFVGSVAAWLLLLFGFGFVLDGVTAAWERAGGTGSLKTHRQ